jgi:hypothetical protein
MARATSHRGASRQRAPARSARAEVAAEPDGQIYDPAQLGHERDLAIGSIGRIRESKGYLTASQVATWFDNIRRDPTLA